MRATVDQLRIVKLFEGMSDDELERIAARTEIRHAEEGERLTREGSTGFFVFLILEGQVVARHGGRDIATLGPGDVFGEMAVEDGIRHADGVAATPCTLASIFGTDFLAIEEGSPTLAAKIREEIDLRRAEL